ncbi:MAG: hypothetical protein ABSF48_29100, partial [Thermodesulfobacteriota bacterium]
DAPGTAPPHPAYDAASSPASDDQTATAFSKTQPNNSPRKETSACSSSASFASSEGNQRTATSSTPSKGDQRTSPCASTSPAASKGD